MSRAHLTDINVRTIKPTGKQFTVWDASLKGFGLRVSQAGSKSWVVMTGRDRRLTTLSRYPTVSLKQARTDAKRLLIDPPKGSQTFGEMLTLFLSASALKNKESTTEGYKWLLKRHFSPTLDKKPLGGIQASEISDIIRALKSTPTTAVHALVAFKVFFNWAVREGHAVATPVATMQLPATISSRERILSDTELKAVWKAAEAIAYPFGTIVLLLIITGQRRGEIAALQKEWITEDAVTLPKQITKNGREHTLPLGTLASSLLQPILEQSQALLFPARGQSSKPFNGWSKSKAKLDRISGVKDYTLHDLRRTFSSGLAALGTPLHVTERLLNHVSGAVSGVAAIYNRYTYMAEMRQAMHAWEAKLESLVRG